MKCDFAAHRENAKSLFSSLQYRASKKVPALTWDDTMYSYCVLHNIDMLGSVLKSSNFSLGHGYNENVAHVPGSAKQVLDVWRSGSKEKENLLFNSARYSAIAVYGDHNECYATPRRISKNKYRCQVGAIQMHAQKYQDFAQTFRIHTCIAPPM